MLAEVTYVENRLFFMSGESAVEMQERPYDTEEVLQKIVEENPHLLARDWGENDCRLFLVQREFLISGDDSAFWLDHLFIAEDAVPVLVEVKRSTDTRIRREVVGQMLDYACRASCWDAGELRSAFRASNPETNLAEIDTDEFWEQVSTNLRAERLRLVFVADKIPDTLRVLIEFLDRSMGDIEVYGVELRRYATSDALLLTSSVVGNSAVDHPASRSLLWSEGSFSDHIREKGLGSLIPTAMEIWRIASKLGLKCSYTKSVLPSFKARLGNLVVLTVNCWQLKSMGEVCTVEFAVKYLADALENSVSEDQIRKLLTSFPGASEAYERRFVWDTPYYLYIDLRSLSEDDNMTAFQKALESLCVKRGSCCHLLHKDGFIKN